MCRGNFRSSWVADGGYDFVAEALFGALDVDGFFLEYDDARSGDFSPLRFVPPGKRVVLGLVTTKRGAFMRFLLDGRGQHPALRRAGRQARLDRPDRGRNLDIGAPECHPTRYAAPEAFSGPDERRLPSGGDCGRPEVDGLMVLGTPRAPRQSTTTAYLAPPSDDASADGSWLRRFAATLLRQPWLLTLLAGTFVVIAARLGPDWPAQEFRTWLARHAGLQAWNDQWYGGHALPGYSVLFPPIAYVLGAGATGLIAATVTAWLAPRLVASPGGRAEGPFGIAVALCLVGNLLIGQVPFLLGTAFGLGALLAVRRERSTVALVLAAACSLSSPLAGLFLLLAGVSWIADLGWRRALPLAAAGIGSLVSAALGGGAGRFPCDWYDVGGVLIFAALTLLFAPAHLAVLRRFALLYAATTIALFLVPNAVGGNMSRLGRLVALPIAAYVLVRHQRRLRLLAVALVPALIWQFLPVTSAIARASGDPSSNVTYYTGLMRFLGTQDPAAGRLEVPFTREHWEAARVAPAFPIARGWERQLDVQYNSALYQPLTAASYRAWLDSSAVALVALPDAPLDYGGQAEAQLLQHPPPYLRLIWHDAHWRVWRVVNAQPLVSGAGVSLTQLDSSSFQLNFQAPTTAIVRIRASNLWRIDNGAGCLLTGADDWLRLRAFAPGLVTAHARVSLRGLAGVNPTRCADDPAAVN